MFRYCEPNEYVPSAGSMAVADKLSLWDLGTSSVFILSLLRLMRLAT